MDDPDVRPSVLDPVDVLRTLAGTGATVEVVFGPGSEVTGAIVASSPDVSVLQNLDGTASFVRHEAVVAVTVREATAFRAELGLAPPASSASAAKSPIDVTGSAATSGPAPLGIEEVTAALGQVGFGYDEAAVAAASPVGRAGIIALASAVDAALQSIVNDAAANEAMTKDIEGIRLVDGPANKTAVEDTTLVVTSPWTQGPDAVFDPSSLRQAIVDAAR